jgi:hypothetical protein
VIGAVVARIAAQVPGLVTVDTLFASAHEMALPAALVGPTGVKASDESLMAAHVQMLETRVSVFLHFARVPPGAPAAAEAVAFEAAISGVRNALCGWSPVVAPEGVAPFRYLGGEMQAYDSGLAVWREDFAVATQLRLFSNP